MKTKFALSFMLIIAFALGACAPATPAPSTDNGNNGAGQNNDGVFACYVVYKGDDLTTWSGANWKDYLPSEAHTINPSITSEADCTNSKTGDSAGNETDDWQYATVCSAQKHENDQRGVWYTNPQWVDVVTNNPLVSIAGQLAPKDLAPDSECGTTTIVPATPVPTLTAVIGNTTYGQFCVGQKHTANGQTWFTNANWVTLAIEVNGVTVSQDTLNSQVSPKEFADNGYCDGTIGTGGNNKTPVPTATTVILPTSTPIPATPTPAPTNTPVPTVHVPVVTTKSVCAVNNGGNNPTWETETYTDGVLTSTTVKPGWTVTVNSACGG